MDFIVKGRQKIMRSEKDKQEIIKKILSILSNQRVSLSETKDVFEDILRKIEDENSISL